MDKAKHKVVVRGRVIFWTTALLLTAFVWFFGDISTPTSGGFSEDIGEFEYTYTENTDVGKPSRGQDALGGGVLLQDDGVSVANASELNFMYDGTRAAFEAVGLDVRTKLPFRWWEHDTDLSKYAYIITENDIQTEKLSEQGIWSSSIIGSSPLVLIVNNATYKALAENRVLSEFDDYASVGLMRAIDFLGSASFMSPDPLNYGAGYNFALSLIAAKEGTYEFEASDVAKQSLFLSGVIKGSLDAKLTEQGVFEGVQSGEILAGVVSERFIVDLAKHGIGEYDLKIIYFDLPIWQTYFIYIIDSEPSDAQQEALWDKVDILQQDLWEVSGLRTFNNEEQVHPSIEYLGVRSKYEVGAYYSSYGVDESLYGVLEGAAELED